MIDYEKLKELKLTPREKEKVNDAINILQRHNLIRGGQNEQ